MKLGKALSGRIRALREAANLSQQDLAMKAELSMSQVAKLEQGKKADPRVSTLVALAAALGVKPGQILDEILPLLTAEHGEAPEKKKKAPKKKKGPKKKKTEAPEEAVTQS